jgi:hypothetical protein
MVARYAQCAADNAMIELRQPLIFDTPKGKAMALFVIDLGAQNNLQWVCFVKDTGECWTFDNGDILLEANVTMGIRCCQL